MQYCKCCNCEKESEASYEFLYFLFPQRLITGQLHWFVCFFCLCLCLLYCGEESESVMNFSAVCSLICFHRLVRPEIAAVWRLTLPLTWNYTKSCQLHTRIIFRQWDVNKPEHWTNCLCWARWWPDGYLLLEALKTQTHFRHFQRLCKI